MSREFTRRQRNVRTYLETCSYMILAGCHVPMSINQLRRFYALYLSGQRVDGEYDSCSHAYKSAAANADIEDVLDALCVNWEDIRPRRNAD